jgi:hypothetical protein
MTADKAFRLLRQARYRNAAAGKIYVFLKKG